jgi:hypothetical protein
MSQQRNLWYLSQCETIFLPHFQLFGKLLSFSSHSLLIFAKMSKAFLFVGLNTLYLPHKPSECSAWLQPQFRYKTHLFHVLYSFIQSAIVRTIQWHPYPSPPFNLLSQLVKNEYERHLCGLNQYKFWSWNGRKLVLFVTLRYQLWSRTGFK